MTELANSWRVSVRDSGVWPSVLLLGLTGLLFVLAQVAINDVNGWWNDELFALWASDTSLPFTTAFADRIAPDTNPPLYFAALYWSRSLIGDDRAAVLALNVVFILAAGSAVLLMARQAKVTSLGAICVAAFVLSGPVLLYAPEGRAYALALSVSFVATWCVALAIEEPDHRPSLWVFAVVGVLGALSHVYAAIFCGVLAGGAFLLGLAGKTQRGVIAPALVLGVSSSLALGLWLLTITGSLERVDWMVLSLETVKNAAWYVKEVAVGHRLTAVLLVLLLSYGLVNKATRPLAIAFGLAYALFVALPLAASLKQPMIMGRYWLVGAPGLVVLIAFLARIWWRQSRQGPLLSPSAIAAAGAGVLLVASSLSGFFTAQGFTYSKPIWRGADVAGPLLKDCPAGSVHVGTGNIHGGRSSAAVFAKMAGTSQALFIDVGADATQPIEAASAYCPVLGWAEHVLLGDGFIATATDADLIRLLKIDAKPGDVEVRRHSSGYVVLKRGDAG